MRKIGRVVVDVYLTSSGEVERSDPVWIPADAMTSYTSDGADRWSAAPSVVSPGGSEHEPPPKTTIDHQWSPPVDIGGPRRAEHESTTDDHHDDQVVTTALESLSNSRGREDSLSSVGSPLSQPRPPWWETRADFEVLHRKIRWTVEPRGKTLHLLNTMARHPMTGPDEEAGQRWVAAELESMKTPRGAKPAKVVDYVYEKKFLPLLGPAAGPQEADPPGPSTRGGRPTHAAAAIREAFARQLDDDQRAELVALIQDPATHDEARRAAQRTLDRYAAPPAS